MRFKRAAICGISAMGIAATRNMDSPPAGRLTPYIDSRPLVAIHARGEEPVSRCDVEGTWKGRADVATISSVPSSW